MSVALVLLLAGLVLIALASAVEVAVFTPPFPRVKELAAAGGRRGTRALASVRGRPVHLLVTLWGARTGGVSLTVLAVWLGLPGAPGLLRAGLAVALGGLAAVLTELAGKVLAQHGDESQALAAARPTWWVMWIMRPLSWPIELLVRLLSPKFGEILPGISDREVRDLIQPGNGDTVIEEHELRLIQRTFMLDQTTAYDIMTPRVDMVAWPDSLTLAEVAPRLRNARYSRIPIYGGSIDKITGVLYVRDAYQALISGQRDVEIKALAREPFFVPGSITLDKLLFDFQARRIHMGVVIDEYGGVDGLVALEDILEELVGEIIDETDIAEESIIRLSRHEILVDGSADLREINHFFNTTFPLLEHRSLNGYLLDVLGRVPEPGEKITAEGVTIEVTAATDTQVLRARLARVAPRVEDAQASAEPPTEPASPGPSPRPDPEASDEGAARRSS